MLRALQITFPPDGSDRSGLRQVGTVETVETRESIETPTGELFALPASYAQRRLWFLDQWAPGSATYNVPDAFRMTGPLQVDALERALNEIIRRHEVLRTTFSFVDGAPMQVIASDRPLTLALVDLSHRPDTEAALRLAGQEASRPFDLAQGPLIRATLYRLADTEHILLIATHHVVTDGWSTGVFLREMAVLYPAFVAGRPSPLPELPIQYADFALWQQEWLDGDVLEEQLAYWRQQLGGPLPTLQLPLARTRTGQPSDRGGIHTVELPAALTRSLTDLAQREDATLFMAGLAGLAVLLDRYSGQHDVVIGAPIANRNRVEIEDLIGFFANTLPLRLDLSGDPSARETLRRAREVCLGAYAHQDVPFEKLVEVLQPERDLSRSPIFQVALTLEADSGEPVTLGAVSLRPVEVDTGTARFDLTLDMTQSGDTLLASFSYRTDLFEAETIRRMGAHFQTLLESMVASPDRPLSTLPLLPEAERRQLMDEWGGAKGTYPPGPLLHERFAAQAAIAPGAIALVYEGQRLTYGELNDRAEALAGRLRALGVGPDVLVALCLERSPGLIVALLGVLKAGGAYLPLDPAYPPDRLAFMLEDSRAPVLITQSHLAGHLPHTQATVLDLDTFEPGAAPGAPAGPGRDDRPTSPDDLAYVIYTSGSTGKPKGVMVTHANVDRLFEATDAWFRFDARDVWTLFHSYAFDFSVWEIWGALLYGGTLVIVPYLTSRSPAAFCELVRKEGVTVLNQTPSAFRQYMAADERAGGPAGRLRLVIFGGEALELQSLRPWLERHGDRTPRLVNMYGITETTVHVTHRPIGLADLDAGLGSVIGEPIPDLELYVLDEHLRPLPIGVPGELYVGGAGLARGYLNRPQLTEARFVPHPFRDQPGARLYRSGDLARYLPQGDLEYLGRIDQQVKLRGFRIELGEIEAALCQHEAVREAVVLLREDAPGEKRLVAYVVFRPDAVPSAGELRTRLLATLPDHMVPAAFVALDGIPLTANGKVDRRALPAPGTLRPALQGAYVAPRTPTQEALVTIWAEVLDLEQVGIRDNFFALGGNSIRSVGVLALARERGLPLTLQQLFRHQTIEELSQALSASAGDALADTATEPFGLIGPEDRARLPEDVEDAYPLTMLQAGMVYHMELSPEFDGLPQRGEHPPGRALRSPGLPHRRAGDGGPASCPAYLLRLPHLQRATAARPPGRDRRRAHRRPARPAPGGAGGDHRRGRRGGEGAPLRCGAGPPGALPHPPAQRHQLPVHADRFPSHPGRLERHLHAGRDLQASLRPARRPGHRRRAPPYGGLP